MHACTVVGYTLDGAFYCPSCLPPRKRYESADDLGTVYAGDEWDYYPTCDSCGEACDDVSLTSEGMAYEHPESDDE